MQEIWKNSLTQAQETLEQFLSDPDQIKKCEEFSQILIRSYESGNKTMTCGNGGSHCDAMHFAEELTGRYRKNRRPLPAMALGDASHTTCVANDYGFEHVFSRQVEAFGQKGDVLIGLSTSGNSQNVINAFEEARQRGVTTVALLGKDGGKLKSKADLAIIAPANVADRIQEMHIKLLHIVIESVERQLFPENY